MDVHKKNSANAAFGFGRVAPTLKGEKPQP